MSKCSFEVHFCLLRSYVGYMRAALDLIGNVYGAQFILSITHVQYLDYLIGIGVHQLTTCFQNSIHQRHE